MDDPAFTAEDASDLKPVVQRFLDATKHKMKDYVAKVFEFFCTGCTARNAVNKYHGLGRDPAQRTQRDPVNGALTAAIRALSTFSASGASTKQLGLVSSFNLNNFGSPESSERVLFLRG